MHSAEQVFQIIQTLPPAERRDLIERLAGELPKLDPADARKLAAEADDPDLLGFLADDPALADEICRIATVEREGNDLRDWGHAESAPELIAAERPFASVRSVRLPPVELPMSSLEALRHERGSR
jgi:hypothetical protein